MTTIEFNKKWVNFIDENKPGLLIENQEVIDYLDKKLTKYKKENVKFLIKTIGQVGPQLVCDVIINHRKDTVIEFKVNKILNG